MEKTMIEIYATIKVVSFVVVLLAYVATAIYVIWKNR